MYKQGNKWGFVQSCTYLYDGNRKFLLHFSATVAISAVSTFSYSLHCMGHCGVSQEVAGSIPDSVTGICHWHNPSGRTVALGSTQPLTEKSTKNISWRVKAVGRLRLTTLPPSLTNCHEIWEPAAPGSLGFQPGGFKWFSCWMKRLLMRLPATPSVSPSHHPTIAPYQPDHPAQCVTPDNQHI